MERGGAAQGSQGSTFPARLIAERGHTQLGVQTLGWGELGCMGHKTRRPGTCSLPGIPTHTQLFTEDAGERVGLSEGPYFMSGTSRLCRSPSPAPSWLNSQPSQSRGLSHARVSFSALGGGGGWRGGGQPRTVGVSAPSSVRGDPPCGGSAPPGRRWGPWACYLGRLHRDAGASAPPAS